MDLEAVAKLKLALLFILLNKYLNFHKMNAGSLFPSPAKASHSLQIRGNRPQYSFLFCFCHHITGLEAITYYAHKYILNNVVTQFFLNLCCLDQKSILILFITKRKKAQIFSRPGQSGEASRWRIFYQWGLPRLVY